MVVLGVWPSVLCTVRINAVLLSSVGSLSKLVPIGTLCPLCGASINNPFSPVCSRLSLAKDTRQIDFSCHVVSKHEVVVCISLLGFDLFS